MRTVSVAALCVVSAGIGAGIDHYWDKLPPVGEDYWIKIRSLTGSNVPQREQKTTSPSGGNGEMLGDRVRCDVRYTELKIPESEYRAFFDRCMGNAASMKKDQ